MAKAIVVYGWLSDGLPLAMELAEELAVALGAELLVCGGAVLTHDARATANTTAGAIRLTALFIALSDELAS
jgi:hypothetical protein